MIEERLADPGPLRTLADILRDPSVLELPETVVPRLAYRGRVTLVAGREKSGKSTLAGAGAACVSAGRPFLGETTTPTRVLWVSLEEHLGDLARRFVEHGAEPENVLVLERPSDGLAELETAVRVHAPRLVVLDSLAEFCDRWVDEASQASQWVAPLAALRSLARTHDLGLQLIHHARKSDGRYRDSFAIGAAVDVILEMEAANEDQRVRRLRARGRFALEDFAVRLVAYDFELVGGELSLDARVVLYVEGNPGCSKRQVREHIAGRASDVDRIVDRLVKEGVLEDRGISNRHQYHRVQGVRVARCPPYRGGHTDPWSGTGHDRVPASSPGDTPGHDRDRDSGHAGCTVSRVQDVSRGGTRPQTRTPGGDYEAEERHAIQEEGAA
jgi:RecA/RadA recombinase